MSIFGFSKEYKYYIVYKTDADLDFELGEIIRVSKEYKGVRIYSVSKKKIDSAFGFSRFKFLDFIKKNCHIISDLRDYPMVLEDIKELNKYRLDYNDKRMGYLKALNLAKERLNEIINKQGEDACLNRKENNCGMCERYRFSFYFTDLEEYPCPFDMNSKNFLKDSESFNKIENDKTYNSYACYNHCLISTLKAKEAKKILNDTEKVVKEAMLKEKRV